jgi:hypothetical protein
MNYFRQPSDNTPREFVSSHKTWKYLNPEQVCLVHTVSTRDTKVTDSKDKTVSTTITTLVTTTQSVFQERSKGFPLTTELDSLIDPHSAKFATCVLHMENGEYPSSCAEVRKVLSAWSSDGSAKHYFQSSSASKQFYFSETITPVSK